MPKPETIPTRSSLLGRVRDPADDVAWRQFEQTYRGLITRLALAAGLRPDEADEVLQEVLVGVTRNIGGYKYDRTRCSFKHWLSQMVRWRIRDQLDKRRDAPPDEAVLCAGRPDQTVAGGPSQSMAPELEAIWEAEWRQHLLRQATARVKRRVSGKQFQVFFLHVLKAMSVGEVVRRLKVSRGQVYLAKLRVGRLFREELRRLEREGESG